MAAKSISGSWRRRNGVSAGGGGGTLA